MIELTQTVFIQHIHLSLSFFSHSNDERANAAGWGESPALGVIFRALWRFLQTLRDLLVENFRTFQKGTGVLTSAAFQEACHTVLVTPITKTTKEKFVPAVSILCFDNKTQRSDAFLSHDNAWSGDILSGYCCHGNKTHTRWRGALFDGAPQRPACFLPEKIYGHKP